eukprot:CAMPEP_0206470646 /NCGR_PEP_ID=MMETSP0324_2-20121206/31064_1 /ASSEMBLY_ACC=CAM_ASM_000836 /TAXON_ID=2866 /ORGANISM="Crypthecodinium cohnii, Strain Seligo" /LENGTH=358 /DNA_ID=CAMNT_0053944765 /DNA_START=37 /DNA_END=1113 /DNA_ORIENTATION=-
MKRERKEGKAVGSRADDPGVAAARMQEDQQILKLSREGPMNPATVAYCGAFASLEMDNSFDLTDFKSNFGIEIVSLSDELVEFDMKGIDAPLANAFRRILIAEVPTIAPGQVTIYQNTSVIHDENLAHRIGLVPLKVDPDRLEWREAEADLSESNSICFNLHVTCEEGKKSVYSSDFIWQPWSDAQAEQFKDDPPRPVQPDILVAQLREGQEIECVIYCEKGVGKEHAKWSPVCTAHYRLLPVITLKKDIVGGDAQKLKEVCPKNVFDIEDLGSKGKKAFVANARNCSTCRECLESFPGDEKGVVLAKDKQHFLFSIESVGQIPAPDLFRRALKKFQDKCQMSLDVLAGHMEEDDPMI